MANKLFKKLEYLRSLEKGWYEDDTESPNEWSLYLAEKILGVLDYWTFDDVIVEPDVEGGVYIEFGNGRVIINLYNEGNPTVILSSKYYGKSIYEYESDKIWNVIGYLVNYVMMMDKLEVLDRWIIELSTEKKNNNSNLVLLDKIEMLENRVKELEEELKYERSNDDNIYSNENPKKISISKDNIKFRKLN